MAEFNNNHPELKDGEVFAINHDPNANAMVDFNNIPYSSKRLGVTAYDCSGNIIPGLQPVFVSKVEFDNHFKHTKCTSAYLVVTGGWSSRKGIPAEIIGTVFFKLEDSTTMLCYKVRFEDGEEDYIAVSYSNNYKIITKDEALVMLQKL